MPKAARFEGNEGGRALCHFSRLTQGVDFGVRFAGFDVETLPDNLTALCDDAADARIGRSGKTPQSGKFEGVLHHRNICFGKHRDTVSVWVGGIRFCRLF